jgi:hypothetical protein
VLPDRGILPDSRTFLDSGAQEFKRVIREDYGTVACYKLRYPLFLKATLNI